VTRVTTAHLDGAAAAAGTYDFGTKGYFLRTMAA